MQVDAVTFGKSVVWKPLHKMQAMSQATVDRHSGALGEGRQIRRPKPHICVDSRLRLVAINSLSDCFKEGRCGVQQTRVGGLGGLCPSNKRWASERQALLVLAKSISAAFTAFREPAAEEPVHKPVLRPLSCSANNQIVIVNVMQPASLTRDSITPGAVVRIVPEPPACQPPNQALHRTRQPAAHFSASVAGR